MGLIERIDGFLQKYELNLLPSQLKGLESNLVFSGLNLGSPQKAVDYAVGSERWEHTLEKLVYMGLMEPASKRFSGEFQKRFQMVFSDVEYLTGQRSHNLETSSRIRLIESSLERFKQVKDWDEGKGYSSLTSGDAFHFALLFYSIYEFDTSRRPLAAQALELVKISRKLGYGFLRNLDGDVSGRESNPLYKQIVKNDLLLAEVSLALGACPKRECERLIGLLQRHMDYDGIGVYTRYKLHTALGELLASNGEVPRAMEHFGRAKALAEEDQDPEKLLSILDRKMERLFGLTQKDACSSGTKFS